MAEPPMPSMEEGSVIEGRQMLNTIVRQQIDVAAMGVRRPGAALGSDNEEDVDFKNSQDTQATAIPEDSQATAATVATRTTRKRFSFARRVFEAGSEFYLNSAFVAAFKEKYPNNHYLVGTVKTCPCKDNAFMYTIDWNLAASDIDPT